MIWDIEVSKIAGTLRSSDTYTTCFVSMVLMSIAAECLTISLCTLIFAVAGNANNSDSNSYLIIT